MNEVIVVVLVVGALAFLVYKLKSREKKGGRGSKAERPGGEQK